MKKTQYSMYKFFVAALMLVSLLPLTTAMKDKPTLVDVAVSVNTQGPYAGQFDTLIAAVLAADPAVAKTLTGKGQFTVFAPTDAAFAELGLDESNVASLPKEDLTKILLYHVVYGRRYAESVLETSRFRTLLGQFFYQENGVLTDQNGGQSSIIVTDVEAGNGLIHAIDKVIMPK